MTKRSRSNFDLDCVAFKDTLKSLKSRVRNLLRVAVGEDETFEMAKVREEIHVLDIKCVDQELLKF